jgi:hypothetical protein
MIRLTKSGFTVAKRAARRLNIASDTVDMMQNHVSSVSYDAGTPPPLGRVSHKNE